MTKRQDETEPVSTLLSIEHIQLELHISQEEVNYSRQLLSQSSKAQKQFLAKLRGIAGIREQFEHYYKLRLQALSFLSGFNPQDARHVSSLIKFLVILKDTTNRCAVLLQQMRQLAGTPLNHSVKVEQQTFYQELNDEQWLTTQQLFNIMYPTGFYSGLGKQAALQKLEQGCAKYQEKLTIHFMINADDQVFRDFWQYVFSKQKVVELDLEKGFTVKLLKQILMQEQRDIKQFLQQFEDEKQRGGYLTTVLMEAVIKSPPKNEVKSPRSPQQNLAEDLNVEIQRLQKQLRIPKDEIAYASELTADTQKLAYKSRLQRVLDLKQSFHTATGLKKEAIDKATLYVQSDFKAKFLEALVDMRTATMQAVSAIVEFHQLVGHQVDFQFEPHPILENQFKEFTYDMIVYAMIASSFPGDIQTLYQEADHEPNVVDIVLGFPILKSKLERLPVLFWANIYDATDQEFAKARGDASGLVHLVEHESEHLTQQQVFNEQCSQRGVKICCVPVTGDKMEVFRGKTEPKMLVPEVNVPEYDIGDVRFDFDDSDHEHDSPIEINYDALHAALATQLQQFHHAKRQTELMKTQVLMEEARKKELEKLRTPVQVQKSLFEQVLQLPVVSQHQGALRKSYAVKEPEQVQMDELQLTQLQTRPQAPEPPSGFETTQQPKLERADSGALIITIKRPKMDRSRTQESRGLGFDTEISIGKQSVPPQDKLKDVKQVQVVDTKPKEKSGLLTAVADVQNQIKTAVAKPKAEPVKVVEQPKPEKKVEPVVEKPKEEPTDIKKVEEQVVEQKPVVPVTNPEPSVIKKEPKVIIQKEGNVTRKITIKENRMTDDNGKSYVEMLEEVEEFEEAEEK